MDMPILAANLAAHLAASGLSQNAFAKAAGVAQPKLSRFLSGALKSLDAATTAKIAAAIGLPGLDPGIAEAAPTAPVNGEAIDDDGGIVMLPLTQLRPSALNPRKTFDQAALDELAESIDHNGLLQNLVVTQDGAMYRIVAGERRWRALRLLVETGRRGPEMVVPCKVVDAFDDADHVALAIVENLQREDVSPLEEAEAFKLLAGLGWTTQRIAAAIKRSRRHVQLRLALVESLAEPAREALAAGKITLAHARELATVSEDLQKEGLGQVTGKGYGNVRTAEDLRRHLRRDFIPVDKALLPPPDDTPGLITLDDGVYFQTRAGFVAWQTQALARRKASLEQQWAWVDVLEPYSWNLDGKRHYQVDDARAFIIRDRERGGGAVIVRDSYNGWITVHEGLLREVDLLSPEDERRRANEDHRQRMAALNTERDAAIQRRQWLQSAVAERAAETPTLGFRLLLLSAFGSYQQDAPGIEWDSQIPVEQVAAIAPGVAAEIGEDRTWRDLPAAWAQLAKLTNGDLQRLVGLLLAEAIWVDDDRDNPILQAIAAEFSLALDPPAAAAEPEAAE